MAKDFSKIPPNRLHWYCALDADASLRLYWQQRRDAGAFERTWRTLHAPAVWALTKMERWGALLSEDNVRKYDAHLAVLIDRYQGSLSACGPQFADFNVRSAPQIRSLLYDKLKFKVTRRTATKQPSTDLETVQTLVTERWGVAFDKATGLVTGDAQEVANKRAADRGLDAVLAVLDLRDALNQRSKYGLGYLKWVGYDGRVHTTYKMARTSRLRSKDPNLQNLTSPDDALVDDPGKWARGIYVPPPGWVIVSLDFAQMELRVAAMLSGDEKMAAAFEQGVDFHTATACEVFGKKAGKEPPEGPSKLERRLAKIINFAMPFGMDEHGLAPKLGCTEDRAKLFIDSYNSSYPVFARWRKARVVEGYRDGQILAQWGDWTHRRRLPDLGESNDSRASDGRKRHAENICVNMPIQCVANCFCLASMARVVGWLADNPKVPAEVNLNVHDALVMYVRRDCWQEVAAKARQLMTQHESGIVKLKVDVELGEENYGNMKKVAI